MQLDATFIDATMTKSHNNTMVEVVRDVSSARRPLFSCLCPIESTTVHSCFRHEVVQTYSRDSQPAGGGGFWMLLMLICHVEVEEKEVFQGSSGQLQYSGSFAWRHSLRSGLSSVCTDFFLDNFFCSACAQNLWPRTQLSDPNETDIVKKNMALTSSHNKKIPQRSVNHDVDLVRIKKLRVRPEVIRGLVTKKKYITKKSSITLLLTTN